MKYLVMAYGFLTTLPIRSRADYQPGDLGRAAGWYSTVGFTIGLLTAAAWWAAARFFPAPVSAFLGLLVWVGLSGGLHLDGLADCCDGLLNASSPERRLEIMKDPRLGTFGGAGLTLLLVGKYAVLMAFSYSPIPLWLIPLAAAAGRWLLLLAGFQRQARPGGMGADFAIGFRKWTVAAAAVPALAGGLWAGLTGWIALGVSTLSVLLFQNAARNRLGGVTGDVMGASIEIGELAVLLTASAVLGGGW